MCDEMGKICLRYSMIWVFANHREAGTLRSAELKVQIPASAFPSAITTSPISARLTRIAQDVSMSTGRSKNVASNSNRVTRLKYDEEFPDDDIDDLDLLAAGMIHRGDDHAFKTLKIMERMN